MSQLTLDHLKQILRSCAGVDESIDLDGDILDTPFSDLGYDSLAVLEVASRIQQEFKVLISDDAAFRMDTPRVMIECVNQLVEV